MQKLIRFPTTRWSLVMRATQAPPEKAREALDQLLRRYWRPLHAYLLRRGFEAGEAEDLLQGFIAERILERKLVASAHARRGRFRTLLLHAMECYLTDQRRYSGRLRRRGDAMAAALHAALEPADAGADPAVIFAVEWARQVLAMTLQAMRSSAQDAGRAELWGIFDARVVRPTLYGEEPVPYSQLVGQLKLSSPEQGANLLVTAKRLFHRCLREVIAGYASDDSDLDAEIVELEEILAKGR